MVRRVALLRYDAHAVVLRSGSTEQNTGSGTAQQNSTSGGASSSQTQILGKVTSIIGNEVELAVGTQSDSQSSSKLTLTGETKRC